MSSLGDCIREVITRAYKILGQIFSHWHVVILRHLRTLLLRLIAHGVCEYFLSLNAWFVEKVDFEEKIRYLPL